MSIMLGDRAAAVPSARGERTPGVGTPSAWTRPIPPSRRSWPASPAAPTRGANLFLALIAAGRGDDAAARAHLAAARAALPQSQPTIAMVRKLPATQDPAVSDRWIAAWRRLGMPK